MLKCSANPFSFHSLSFRWPARAHAPHACLCRSVSDGEWHCVGWYCASELHACQRSTVTARITTTAWDSGDSSGDCYALTCTTPPLRARSCVRNERRFVCVRAKITLAHIYWPKRINNFVRVIGLRVYCIRTFFWYKYLDSRRDKHHSVLCVQQFTWKAAKANQVQEK